MKVRAVILVHGYNVSNLEVTVGKLRDHFEHYDYFVEALTYGFLPFTWQVTKHNRSIAKQLADRVKHYQSIGFIVDVVGHSNGCTIGNLATELYGMKVNTFVAINPALKKDLNPCKNAELVQVWHNDGDVAVEVSMWLRWLSPWAIKSRPWGEQGKEGYTGEDSNVVNFDCSKDFIIKADGHSAVFKKPVSNFYLPTIARFCAREKKRVKQ